ncbi:zinc finger protein 850 [Drosophila novamexicana]|uniref:zinc finger protein 850 n=1 Tax=Drosophila novamexicana TaxID=47314 RepID=UPI0011E5E052|nr:zinc finger protein 850 [Drosophila novamexicana]
MDLCKLCVQNKAVSTEHLDEFKHATELLQHLFTSFQIQADVQELSTCACHSCMAEVLSIWERLQCWSNAQQNQLNVGDLAQPLTITTTEYHDENSVNDLESDIEDVNSELELIDGDEDYETLDAQLCPDVMDENTDWADESPADNNFAIAIAHDGVVLAKAIRNEGLCPELICYYCSTVFSSTAKLQTHSNMSHNLRYYVCRKCGVSFDNASLLQQHEQVMGHERKPLDLADESSVEFRCQECGCLFDRYFSMVNHENQVHRHRKEEFKCRDCGSTFKFQIAYNQHIKKHLNSKKNLNAELLKQFACSFDRCEKRFACRYQLLAHERMHLRIYSCEICGKQFSYKSNMSRHRRTVHMDECSL